MKRALPWVLALAIPVAIHAAPKLPKPDHIVIVFEENKGPQDLTIAAAPYLTRGLAPTGASLGKMYAFHHPSQANYFEFFAGTNRLDTGTVCGDNCLPRQSRTWSLYNAIASTPGVTFAGFAEDLPANMTNAQIVQACLKSCPRPPCNQCYFALKHAPWINFTAVPDSATRPFSAFPKDFRKLPTISIVIPNLLSDMHSVRTPTNCQIDGPGSLAAEVAQGDAWLKTNFAAYAKWAMTHNSLLIITWDENESERDPPIHCAQEQKYNWPNNKIATYIIGQHVKAGYTSQTVYNHYDLLNTILEMYGMPAVGGSAGANVITDIWK